MWEAIADPALAGLGRFTMIVDLNRLYNGARFILAGTPSGVSLAPEGGAHQSTITPDVGLGLPQRHYAEPAYATELDWLLTDAITQLNEPEGQSTSLRLSTRPIDQTPFGNALDRYGAERLRTHVVAGGYRLIDPERDSRPAVMIVTTGATAPEAIDAARTLDDEGITATVIHLTSPTRAYTSWQARIRHGATTATAIRRRSHVHQLIPPSERGRPIISVHDAASSTLAWVGSAIGTRHYPLGVDRFGESGTIADLHDITGISAGHIVNAAHRPSRGRIVVSRPQPIIRDQPALGLVAQSSLVGQRRGTVTVRRVTQPTCSA